MVVPQQMCLWFQELERQKHTCTVLQHKQEELKEGIRQRDELIEVRLPLRWENKDHITPLFCQHLERCYCVSAGRRGGSVLQKLDKD